MKKILLVLACVFGMSITAFSESVVFLQHGGNITSFKADQINDALAAAVNGDIIYLSEGTYPGFIIDKQISIKGTGQQTHINGDIVIQNADNVTLTGVFIGYLEMKKISVKTAVNNLRVSQCKIASTEFLAITENAHFEKCNIEELYVGQTYTQTVTVDGSTKKYVLPYIKGLVLTNSICSHYKQLNTERIVSNVSFINSYINGFSIGGSGNTYYHVLGTTFINSILNSNWSNSWSNIKLINSSVTISDKVNTSDSEISNRYDEKITDYSAANITAKGYLGNDGTIIGPFGGSSPYTLIPTTPRVSESTLAVDPDKKELKLTLKVSPK